MVVHKLMHTQTHSHTHTIPSFNDCLFFTLLTEYRSLNSQSCLFLFLFLLLSGFSVHWLAVIPVLSSTMSQTCALPLQHPHPYHPNPCTPISCSHYFLVKRSLCPLVSDSQRCVRISRYHRHPCFANPSSNTRSSTPPPHPCLLVHMQRKEASPLWQQQNTTLQKRFAPLTVTIKKGVDRIRAGDDDLRGRDVQKEARREEKELSFLCLIFFIPFFHFPRIHQAPLDTCLTRVALISLEGGVPFSPLHATPSRSPFLFHQFTFQNRR